MLAKLAMVSVETKDKENIPLHGCISSLVDRIIASIKERKVSSEAVKKGMSSMNYQAHVPEVRITAKYD